MLCLCFRCPCRKGGECVAWEANGEGTKTTATRCLQKLMSFPPGFGCYRTVLIIAAVVGDTDIMRLLLQRGADPSLTDITGMTARGYLATLHSQE